MNNAFILTGGIATGKSTVSKILKEKGFDIVDLDKIAHEELSINAQKLAEIFGKEYLKNGEIDRKKLGNLIFNNKKAKKILEDFIHPLIRNKVAKISQQLDKKNKPYILDIPLFFENQKAYKAKFIILVYTSKETQLKRLVKRSNLSLEEANLRISSQIGIEEKVPLANFILNNNGELHELPKKVEELIQWIRKSYASSKI